MTNNYTVAEIVALWKEDEITFNSWDDVTIKDLGRNDRGEIEIELVFKGSDGELYVPFRELQQHTYRSDTDKVGIYDN